MGTMVAPDHHRNSIERFMNGDSNDDKLELHIVHRSTENSIPLARRFFKFLREQENVTYLSSLLIDFSLYTSAELSEVHQLLVDALAETKVKKVDTLKIYSSFVISDHEEEILRGLTMSGLEVKEFLLSFSFLSSHSLKYLLQFLQKTKSSLQSLTVPSLQCSCQDDVIELAKAFQQLNLTSLDLRQEWNGDHIYMIQQLYIFLDMSSLEHLIIDSKIIFDPLLADAFCHILFPKLTRLKCFDIFVPDRDNDDNDAILHKFSTNIGKAIQSNPSIESLHFDWSDTTLSSFEGVIPALRNCKFLKLVLGLNHVMNDLFAPDDDAERIRQAELHLFHGIIRSQECSKLERLDLQVNHLFKEPEDLHMLASSLGFSCSSLRSLSISNNEWDIRDYHGEILFPQLAEANGLLDIVRGCPSLLYFDVPGYDLTTLCPDLCEELCKRRLCMDELLQDKIPAKLWPVILAKSMKETGKGYQAKRINLGLLYELVKVKSDTIVAASSAVDYNNFSEIEV